MENFTRLSGFISKDGGCSEEFNNKIGKGHFVFLTFENNSDQEPGKKTIILDATAYDSGHSWFEAWELLKAKRRFVRCFQEVSMDSFGYSLD